MSALPDAVSNIAVAVCRATNRLGYSVAINIGILVTTVTSSWLLMPRLGLLGVGVSWLGAQLLGAIASIPAYLDLRREGRGMQTTAPSVRTRRPPCRRRPTHPAGVGGGGTAPR